MLKKIFWLFTVATAVAIFCFSAQPAEQSNHVSSGVTEKIVDLSPKVRQLPPAEKQKVVANVNNAVRKYAHFTLFAVLGLFITLALFRPEQKWFITLAIALGFCILYAASDEIHQLFVPGRGAQFRDVMIDFSGAILGSGISTGINLLRRRR